MTEELLPFCECGCGLRVTKKGNRFINYHQSRGDNNPMKNPEIAAKRRGIPNSPEHNAKISATLMEHPVSKKARKKMSDSHTDVPLSPEHSYAIVKALQGISKPLRTPEHCTALSEALKNSDAHKVSQDRQRGGHDIVEHHYIYDHSDLLKYTMKMTRSAHSRLMQISGIKVPHINIKK